MNKRIYSDHKVKVGYKLNGYGQSNESYKNTKTRKERVVIQIS